LDIITKTEGILYIQNGKLIHLVAWQEIASLPMRIIMTILTDVNNWLFLILIWFSVILCG